MLLSAGHPAARRYPIGRLWDEAAFVIERENARIVTETKLIREAVWGLLSSKGGTAFVDSVSKMNVMATPLELTKNQGADEWQEKMSNS